jgi:DNA-binding MarR family transcriptional regulator
MVRLSNHNRREELALVVSELIGRLQEATGRVDAAGADLLGVNSTDLRILETLLRRGSMPANAVAAEVALSRGATTTALDRLERRGFVARSRGEHDRREVSIEITPLARRHAEAIWAPIARAGVELLVKFSEADLEAVQRFLEAACVLQEAEAERVRAMRGPTARAPRPASAKGSPARTKRRRGEK